MTIKTSPTDKKLREARVTWQQTFYSPIALRMFEEATGQRFVQLPHAVAAPVAAIPPTDVV